MRHKPVSRDEVRFNGRDITTLPTDSVRAGKYGLEAIPRLWAPLLRSLKRAQAAQNKRWAEQGIPVGKPNPPRAPEPHWHAVVYRCQQCRRKFYRAPHASGRWCSDVCATKAEKQRRAVGIAAVVKARSKERAEARAGRKCETCGEPIKAKRSTMRYCSVRCRVAAHRTALAKTPCKLPSLEAGVVYKT